MVPERWHERTVSYSKYKWPCGVLIHICSLDGSPLLALCQGLTLHSNLQRNWLRLAWIMMGISSETSKVIDMILFFWIYNDWTSQATNTLRSLNLLLLRNYQSRTPRWILARALLKMTRTTRAFWNCWKEARTRVKRRFWARYPQVQYHLQ